MRAMMLLASPGLSIKTVAERLGYSNVANFSRAFQRWTGMSPGEHRTMRRPESRPAPRRLEGDGSPGLGTPNR